MREIAYIKPNWAVPENVKAYTTTRQNGYSSENFTAFNLADHVGDDPKLVAKNRQKLQHDLNLPSDPCWLNQQHTANVINLVDNIATNIPADASYTYQPRKICAVLTADCLPILLCDKPGKVVAVIHAGWRGLAAGIIEATIAKLETQTKVASLLAWFGPAIGPTAFFVGRDVYDIFVGYDKTASAAFTKVADKQWLANIYLLARQRLLNCGVSAIYGGEFCTYTEANRFFSYRRDGKNTGRLASLIWLE